MIIITDTRTGDIIEVTVAGVHGVDVRLGINAPRHITVDRLEIAESKRLEAAAALS